LEDVPEEFDDLVSFREVHATGVRLFPYIPDGIETNNLHSLRKVKKQDIDHVQKYLGVPVVQVNLVRTEGCPDILFAPSRLEFRKKRGFPGPENVR
jgi:hypothetical protein